MSRPIITVSALAGGLSLACCQYLIYLYAPEEQVMGLAQKIFYLHLPAAWWGLFSFGLACISSLFYLKTHRPSCDLVAAAAVETGMLCCTLALLTGSIWARHSWGVWWTWDPRLTTALILWFIYAGYLTLRSMPMSGERRSALCAVVAVAGFLDVPLVFLSARLWRSIHPAVITARGGGLETEMAVTAASCTLAFGLIWLCLLLGRYRQMILSRRLESLAIEQMMAGADKKQKQTF